MWADEPMHAKIMPRGWTMPDQDDDSLQAALGDADLRVAQGGVDRLAGGRALGEDKYGAWVVQFCLFHTFGTTGSELAVDPCSTAL